MSPVNCCWFSENWILSEKREKLEWWLMIRGRRSCNWSPRRSAIKPIVRQADSSKASTETINLLSALRFLSRHTAITSVLSAERGFFWIEMFLISVFLLGINAKYWHLRGVGYWENVCDSSHYSHCDLKAVSLWKCLTFYHLLCKLAHQEDKSI